MRRCLPVLFLVAMVAIPQGASAQARNSSGLWLGLGLGGGWGRIGCDLCVADRELGYTGSLSFGGTVRDGLLVGAEVDGWTYSRDDARQTIGSLHGVLTMYPRPDQTGLFVKGGLGVSYTKVTEDDEDVNATTVGVLLGVGHEYHLAPGWSLLSTVNIHASSFGTLKAGDQDIVSDVSNTVIRFTVGVKKH